MIRLDNLCLEISFQVVRQIPNSHNRIHPIDLISLKLPDHHLNRKLPHRLTTLHFALPFSIVIMKGKQSIEIVLYWLQLGDEELMELLEKLGIGG